MKMRRLISALVVFTLVMASVVSVSAAATVEVTTTYEGGNATVEANVTGAKANEEMITYIIYGNDKTPTEDNIVYIDQRTANADGKIAFNNVKGTLDEVAGKYIRFGTTGALTSNGTVAKFDTVKYVSLDADPAFKAASETETASWTFLLTVSPAITGTVGIDVVFGEEENEVTFENLNVLGYGGVNNTAAIALMDNADTTEDDACFDASANVNVKPYYINDSGEKVYLVKNEGLYVEK